MPARVPVTAVLVAHDGSRWLPEALAALAAQSVTPDRIVAVDTGSGDDSAALLRRATGHVVAQPRATRYAVAVAVALSAVPADHRWIWLLHDDCAPDPEALSLLLRAAAQAPSAGVLGPKVVDWDDPRVLVEIGCSTDASGVRDPGLEPGELDQGQHDGVRQVLAVGTAGALIRRDVWDELGGLDAELAGLRDDLDLGWRVNAAGHAVLVVPAARVRHARAATTGQRVLDSGGGSTASVDRQAAMQVVLANTTGRRLSLVLLLLVVGCLLRALALLLGRRPGETVDELGALLRVLARPGRLHRMRRARAATRRADQDSLRPLMSSPVTRGRARVATLLDRGSQRPVPALDEPERPRSQPLRTRPGVVLGLSLAAVAVLAERALLGRGVLSGGRLLPPPEDAGALWSAYADTADPALAVVAALATALLGSASLAVDLLLLAAVPLSGLTGYVAARAVVRNPVLRVWAGATWALLPVSTGAVAAGRLDAAAVHVALPALLAAAHRVLRHDPRQVGWPHAWALGLALAVVVALSPLVWLLAAALLGAAAAVRLAAAAPAQRASARRRAVAVVVVLAVPVLLLLPWSYDRLGARALLHGPGRVVPELADPLLPAWHLLVLQPGGPGVPALLVTAPVLLAALGGLLRSRRARVAAAGWGIGLVGLAGALALVRSTVDGVPVWPGVTLDVAAAGMLLAALIGAEGLQAGLARSAFGWRQLTAVLVVLAAAAVPLVSAAGWVGRGAAGPLEHVDRRLLPAFVTAELEARSGTRALLLAPRRDGSVGYAVTGAAGPTLGDQPAEADGVVADLLAPRGSAAAAAAAGRGIGFVVLAGGEGAAPLTAALDAQPGLERQPGEAPALWRVTAPVRPAPEPGAPERLLPLWLQAAALLVVVVLAGPGLPPRRGLERGRR